MQLHEDLFSLVAKNVQPAVNHMGFTIKIEAK